MSISKTSYSVAYGMTTMQEESINASACQLSLYVENGFPENLYTLQTPSSWWERLKWRLRFQNATDEAIFSEYNKAITLLENTKPTTILQLKNHLFAFWHLDRGILAYQQNVAREHEQFFNSVGKCSKIFYAFMRFVLSFFLSDFQARY